MKPGLLAQAEPHGHVILPSRAIFGNKALIFCQKCASEHWFCVEKNSKDCG
jgi:hypothetical protein